MSLSFYKQLAFFQNEMFFNPTKLFSDKASSTCTLRGIIPLIYMTEEDGLMLGVTKETYKQWRSSCDQPNATCIVSYVDPENSLGGGRGPDNVFFSFLRFEWSTYFKKGQTDLPLEDPGSVAVFLRKPIAACEFPGGGGGDRNPAPSGSAHVFAVLRAIFGRGNHLYMFHTRKAQRMHMVRYDIMKHARIQRAREAANKERVVNN